MKKLLTISILTFLLIALVGGIDWTSEGIVYLASPANDSTIYELTTEFTGNVSTGAVQNLTNLSFYSDISGSWQLDETFESVLSPVNQSNGLTLNANAISDSSRWQEINITNQTVSVEVIKLRALNGNGNNVTISTDTTASSIIAESTDFSSSGNIRYFSFNNVQLSPGTYYLKSWIDGNSIGDWRYETSQPAVVNDYLTWINDSDNRIWQFQEMQISSIYEVNEFNWSHNKSIPFGTYKWNIEACATDGTCGFGINGNYTIASNLSVNSIDYTTNSFETEEETFRINITSNPNPSSATLIWNGTSRTSTINSIGGNNYTIFNTFDIPVDVSSADFYWDLNFNSDQVNSSTNSQNINTINLSLIGSSPQNVPYINFTFKNETTSQEDVTASIPRSNFVYFLGSGSVNKTFSFTETSEETNYTLAFSPAYKNLNVIVDMDYDNSESQQRTYNPSSALSLSNSTTERVLFLLPTNDGIFVTFQVINLAEQPIKNAEVRIENTAGDLISETLTSSSGTTTVFLNPNTPYLLNVSKSGFSDFTTTQTFPTNEFTITLGSQATTTDDFSRGILLEIDPELQILQNNTDYPFNFTINSSFWNLQEYGFTLTNTTDVLGRVTDTTSTGGTVSITNNTGDNRLITMEYYWKINDTYVNASVSWGVDVYTEGSILGFIERLKAYLGDGIFGANQFTIAMIVFLAIFLTTAVLSYSFGLRSPESITFISIAVIALFDIGFNLISLPFEESIRGAPTFIALMIGIVLWLGRNR